MKLRLSWKPPGSSDWRSDDNDWSYDARLAVLPYYDEPSNGRYLVHLGGSYSFRHIGGLTSGAAYNQNVAYNPLNGLAQFNTGSWVGSQSPIGFGAEFTTNEYNEIAGEFLTIWGAASVQSEYFQVISNNGEQFNGAQAGPLSPFQLANLAIPPCPQQIGSLGCGNH